MRSSEPHPWETASSVLQEVGPGWAVFGVLVLCDPNLAVHAARGALLALGIEHRLEMAPNHEHLWGYLLRDVGQLEVPAELLDRPGALTDPDREPVAAHPMRSAHLVHEACGSPEATSIALHHHERWDGQGYPHGLAGEEIPLPARVAAVADAFAALTARRPYRPAMPAHDAITELMAHSGTQFDPAVTGTLADLEPEIPPSLRTASGWTMLPVAVRPRIAEHVRRAQDLRGARLDALFACALGLDCREAAQRLGRAPGTQRTWKASVRRAIACPPRVPLDRFLATLGRDVFSAFVPAHTAIALER